MVRIHLLPHRAEFGLWSEGYLARIRVAVEMGVSTHEGEFICGSESEPPLVKTLVLLELRDVGVVDLLAKLENCIVADELSESEDLGSLVEPEVKTLSPDLCSELGAQRQLGRLGQSRREFGRKWQLEECF